MTRSNVHPLKPHTAAGQSGEYFPRQTVRVDEEPVAKKPNSVNTPNFNRRRVTAILLAALAITGVVKAGEAAVDSIRSNNLASELTKDGELAPTKYDNQEYAGKPVSKVTFNKPQGAQAAAANLTPNTKDILETRHILTAQAGDTIEVGERAVLPNEQLLPKYQQPNPK